MMPVRARPADPCGPDRAASPGPLAEATPAELVAHVTARLAAAGVPSPAADARWLVDHVTETASGDQAVAWLQALVARRITREPVQLVTGRTWFRHLELRCTDGVFIPRPETEVVAQVAIDAACASGPRPLVVEPCTGTGAIALSVAVEVPGARVVAADVDAAAVALASTNLRRAVAGEAGPRPAAGSRVEVVESDLLDGLDSSLRGAIDVLVANPPYLPAADLPDLQPEVADHDPARALFGGPDGHEIVDTLLGLAATWLRPSGTVVLEIDARRAARVLAAARTAGLVDRRVVTDLTGADRVLVARRSRG